MRSVLFQLVFGYLCLCIVPLSLAKTTEIDSGEIRLSLGNSTIVYHQNITRIALGNPEIANVRVTETDEILVTAQAIGSTDIRFWTSSGVRYLYHILVEADLSVVVDRINTVLDIIPGVDLREENGLFFIEGRILRGQDAAVLNTLLARVEDHINTGRIIVNVTNMQVVDKQMIMLDVRLVEVRKQVLRSLGIRWAASAQGPVISAVENGFVIDPPEGVEGLITGLGVHMASSLQSQLDFLSSKGAVRILAQPNLTTTSGSTADFLAGSQIPIPTVNNEGNTVVEFRDVGIILTVEPNADPSGLIESTVTVEVSALDPAVSVLGIPGFITRRTTADFNIQDGQTMVLSGLLSIEDTQALDKLPGLSKIPVLGELFKSRSFSNRETELVVFVTPHLVEADSSKNQELLEYSHEMIKNVQDSLRFKMME